MDHVGQRPEFPGARDLHLIRPPSKVRPDGGEGVGDGHQEEVRRAPAMKGGGS